MDDRKIVGFIWFTDSFGTIGIVIVKLNDKEEKAYIGHGFGHSEIADVWHIADWGVFFPLKEAKEIIAKMGRSYTYTAEVKR